jgi:hypothetical protein
LLRLKDPKEAREVLATDQAAEKAQEGKGAKVISV